jgi:hypothetical protein
MIYEVNPAAQANRYFSKDVLYSQIDWTKLDQVVDAFQQRSHDWYLGPAADLARNGHFAFSVMALNCLLIETFSQFVSNSSGRAAFKGFIRERLPGAYSSAFGTPIRHDDGAGHQIDLNNIADVLYHGFRCGILHQAHITPYGTVDPGAVDPVRVAAAGFVTYKDTGADCPTIIVNPLKLRDDLASALEHYVGELKDRHPRNDPLRANFKSKFSSIFGVNVDTAA